MNVERIAHELGGAKKSGQGFVARCPAHEDHNPSLSITERDGKLLVKCFSGCPQTAIVAALKARSLWPEPDETRNRIEAIYHYSDERGDLLYQIVRMFPKRFLQRYPDGAGGWIWKKHPRQVLYRLREVLEAPIVFVCEGEKDCESLRDFGFVATTNSGGAQAPWLESYTDALRGREAILIPDRDAPGRQRVLRIARHLAGKVARLVILELEDGKDVTEWFQRGHSELELIAQLDGKEVSS